MSEVLSAIPGAKFKGAVAVEEAGLRGMITLRGNLADTKLKTIVKKITGVELPAMGNINLKAKNGAAWMSPDELLILCPYSVAEKNTGLISKVLNGTHHLVVNVSDARATFTLSGAGSQEVLAKLSPADLSPKVFVPGQIRRSRIAQVPAAFWISGPDQIDVVCFRSVAEYVFALLKQAAHPQSKVGYF
ncbi:MAG: sarcosine oxidase subunit gamma [Marinosulfonomonas sp.]|nr:MAG: sarcosine oxidase subunit gamma [Marinosulfonomonas sp.]